MLMGGRSEEREVSLSTGRMILSAIDRNKYNAFAVDTGKFGNSDSASETASDILPLEYLISPDACTPKPDIAFIALHGRFGEDGTVQGMLELIGMPYVGSGVLASALAMNKIMTRNVFSHAGIPVAKGLVVYRTPDISSLVDSSTRELGYPVVVKPNHQGSSIGLSIAQDAAQLFESLELAFKYDSDVLLEAFVRGTEITCPVLGNVDPEALPVIEIVPASGVYDYEAKYTAGATEEIVPARIPASIYARAQELAIACHRVLGCRDMSRTDMIVQGTDIYVLETNTIPGMTPTSLLPQSARAAGIEFPVLLDRLIGYAIERG